MKSLRHRITRGLTVAALVTGTVVAAGFTSGTAHAADTSNSTYFFKGKTNQIQGLSVPSDVATSLISKQSRVLTSITLGPDNKGTLAISDSMPARSYLTLSYGYSSFSGSSLSFVALNYEVVKQALQYVTYTSPADDANTLTVKTMFTEAKDNLAYFPTNQHFYEFVKYPSGTTAANKATDLAQTAALASKQLGLSGYLANIGSAAENDFVSTKIEGAKNVWIGGTDVTTEGTWVYTEGPEKGKTFWRGCGAESTVTPGVAAAGGFARWSPGATANDGEPNNWISNTNYCGGSAYNPDAAPGEDCIVTNKTSGDARYTVGYWNDFPCSGAGSVEGYVIEYGNATDSSTFSNEVGLGTLRLVAATPPQLPQPKPTVIDWVKSWAKPALSALKRISPAEQRRRAAAAKQAEKENGKIQLAGGGKIGTKKTNCGTYYVLDLSLTAGTKIGPSDRYSFYLTNADTNKLIPIPACSTIQGRVLTKDYSVPVLKPQPGQKIVMSLLVYGGPNVKDAKGTKIAINVIYQQRQEDGSFKLSRSEIAPKEPITLK